MRSLHDTLFGALSLTFVAAVTVSPASAFIFKWADEAANHTLAVAGCVRQMYPGLQGEEFEKAVEHIRREWRTAEALTGKKMDCEKLQALARGLEALAEKHNLKPK